jgi:hypothetical protein
MKRFGSYIFVILATTVIAIAVAAQTSLTLWPYYVEVTPNRNAAGLDDVVLPLDVLDKAGAALDDLRLFDAANREIPYAIRIRRDVNETRRIQANLFNASRSGSISEASLDLGENPGEHNEVEIETTGENFRRRVTVEGSDSRSDWKMLQDNGVIFSFSSRSDNVESDRVSYPTSRYRYLRIRVQRDELIDNEAPQITSAGAVMVVRRQGQLATWSVPVPSYQLERNQGAHASVWHIDLGAYAPCDRLTIDTFEESFSRPFKVEAIDNQDNVRLIASGTLTRHTGVDPKPLVIFFNQEERARQLRLQITDYSNPVLNIISIDASAPARQLLYELKEPVMQPLRLYFGNANVPAPHYDFANVLPFRRLNEATHSTIGQVTANPDYKPEPKPLTERVPWLIYIVLAASSIALGFILLSLARSAIRLRTTGSIQTDETGT